MKDFRATNMDLIRAVLEEGGREALNRHAFSGLPSDRKGLIAVFHPLIEYTGGFLHNIHETAKMIAVDQMRAVFYVMNEQKWRMVILGFEQESTDDHELSDGWWYDDNEDGEFANDQFVSHYRPDGSYHVDSIS